MYARSSIGVRAFINWCTRVYQLMNAVGMGNGVVNFLVRIVFYVDIAGSHCRYCWFFVWILLVLAVDTVGSLCGCCWFFVFLFFLLVVFVPLYYLNCVFL